jgi:hypothetical protein
MTDELRKHPVDASASPRVQPVRGSATRRPYVRPELMEFGSVHDLTRGASSGTCPDNVGRFRNKKLPC